ncbi:MAG TPA: hypothetical protein PLL54_05340 [Dermatophilaceae bacterium]|nr:hypothetical protein [Dermatophilaceae bacterium]
MTHPLRVDQLAADTLMLDDLAGRRYAGHDPLGLALAAFAAACDEPIGPSSRSRHRRRIGWSTLATGFFLASGIGVAAAVSGTLPSADEGWARPPRVEQPVSIGSGAVRAEPLAALVAPQVLPRPTVVDRSKFAELFSQVAAPTVGVAVAMSGESAPAPSAADPTTGRPSAPAGPSDGGSGSGSSGATSGGGSPASAGNAQGGQSGQTGGNPQSGQTGQTGQTGQASQAGQAGQTGQASQGGQSGASGQGGASNSQGSQSQGSQGNPSQGTPSPGSHDGQSQAQASPGTQGNAAARPSGIPAAPGAANSSTARPVTAPAAGAAGKGAASAR